MLKRIYDWMGNKVHSRYSTALIAFLFFIEAIFFVPVDPLLILFCLERKDKAIFYATVVTIASVIGGLASYLLGFATWELFGAKLVKFFSMENTFERSVQMYKTYEIWAVLIAGFTPIPFKAITLSAGFCKLPLIPFLACSAIARGARFFLIAIAVKIWGDSIKYYIDKYFNQLALLFVVIIILFVLILK